MTLRYENLKLEPFIVSLNLEVKGFHMTLELLESHNLSCVICLISHSDRDKPGIAKSFRKNRNDLVDTTGEFW